MKVMKNIIKLFILCLYVSQTLSAQSYYVDKKGVLRSNADKKEVSFFGVNYTLPFAHAYRMHKASGVDIKQAIDRDVYHFARLGFNAYRIHVWDVELTDEKGNLIENEHLDLMDYLIAKLKERNIKILYTPIAYWGNGYPERDEKLPGFSARWNKCDATRVEEAIQAQENYLFQFVEHTNPYTGLKIKNDPDVVGFEINNEPCNATNPGETTLYVDRMVNSIRKKAGCKKPVFYNVTHNFFHNTQAFYNADIDGTTFQWYPSGLVANGTRTGNFLPYVDSYPIPFDNIKNYKNKAKVVYEFDPADIIDPYLYPATVRSFRGAGFQWITQFAYDPMQIAYANTEYQTHFLNLAYTPGKAISMKIAAEVAKRLPRNANYGVYPQDTIFDQFRVSYREKSSVMNAPDKYFYANNTSDRPLDPEELKEIAGCGSSPLVSYEGTGAYFLDKLADGIWRLEVMPDAVCVKDPFAKASPDKEVVTILWRQWPMRINLAELGDNFSFKGLNEGNNKQGKATERTIDIAPGTYLLTRSGVNNTKWTTHSIIGSIRLNEYAAPADRVKTFDVIHKPAKAVTAGQNHKVEVTVIGAVQPDSVYLFPYNYGERIRGVQPIKMEHTKGYAYSADIPGDKLQPGTWQYLIVIYAKHKSFTFPANKETHPMDWDYYQSEVWSIQVEPADKYITLFEAGKEHDQIEVFIVKGNRFKKMLRTGSYPGLYYSRIEGKELKPENELLLRHYIKDHVTGRKDKLTHSKTLCLKPGETKGFDTLYIGVISADGLTYKKEVKLTDDIIRIPLSELLLTQTILQPQCYPSFLPDYFTPEKGSYPLVNNDIEFIEISTGKGKGIADYILELENAWLE